MKEERIRIVQEYIPVKELATLVVDLQAVWFPAQDVIFGKFSREDFPRNDTDLYGQWQRISSMLLSPIRNGFELNDLKRLAFVIHELPYFLEELGEASCKSRFYIQIECEAKKDLDKLYSLFLDASINRLAATSGNSFSEK